MRVFLLFMAAAAVTWAQTPGIMPVRPPQSFDDVRNALGLTDAQIAQLRQLQTTRMEANQAIYQKMAAEQKDLNEMLNNGTGDAATVGKLAIDIQNMRKQIPTGAEGMRDQAVAILTPEQKVKLESLQEAMNKRPAIDQALQLNLLTYQSPTMRPMTQPGPVTPSGISTTVPRTKK